MAKMWVQINYVVIEVYRAGKFPCLPDLKILVLKKLLRNLKYEAL